MRALSKEIRSRNEWLRALERPYFMEPELPLRFALGPENTIRINGRAEVHMSGEVKCLIVGGIPLLTWASDDVAGEHFAMVQLVRDGLAGPTEIAEAFGTTRRTVYRAMRRFAEGGLAALVHRKHGPKGPRILKDAVARSLLGLKEAGHTNVDIASRLGVTEGAVRAALGRMGYVKPEPEQVELDHLVALDVEDEELPTSDAVLEETSSAGDVTTDAAPDAEVEDDLEAVEMVASSPDVGRAAKTVVTGQRSALVGTDAWNRDVDRVMARVGLLNEAPPLFGACDNVNGIGVLLAVPALVQSGFFDVVAKLYAGWKSAFYGVRTVFFCLALMALQRVKNPEQLRHHVPAELGRALGLDRAPEVRTLRNKVAFLAGQGQAEAFVRELASRRAASHPEAMGFLYVDGHVRVYAGKTKLGKVHVTRMRLSMPATVDHWVNDKNGDPVMVVTATPTASLAKEMMAIADDARAVLGERRATVVFDRGGWSPKVFSQLLAKNFDVMTYRKGKYPKARADKFSTHEGVLDGRKVRYALCEREVHLGKKGTLQMREVLRLSDDGKHQTSIVTSRRDLSTVEVAYRMFERWRQENFFKYMRAEYAIDALFTYGTEPAEEDRDVPNPRRKKAEASLREARVEVQRLERMMGAAVADNEESQRPTVRGFKIANADVGKELRAARAKVVKLHEALGQIPARVTAAEAAGGEPVVRLKTEAKRLTDTIKTVAYQAETALLRMVEPHYARADDEGRKLIASALDLSGDLSVSDGTLLVTLEPAASPNRTKALAKMCEELTATKTIYPGTQLALAYRVREA